MTLTPSDSCDKIRMDRKDDNPAHSQGASSASDAAAHPRVEDLLPAELAVLETELILIDRLMGGELSRLFERN